MSGRQAFVEGDHVDAGVCHCEWVTTVLAGRPRRERVPSRRCGLSTHRVEAAAAAELARRD